MKTLKFYLEDRGDSSVGIFPWKEEITIDFKYGGWDFSEIEPLLKECLCDIMGECKVRTESEQKEYENYWIELGKSYDRLSD